MQQSGPPSFETRYALLRMTGLLPARMKTKPRACPHRQLQMPPERQGQVWILMSRAWASSGLL